MKEEEIEKAIAGHQQEKFFFFRFGSDLNQAVPNHLADESQTRQMDAPPGHHHHHLHDRLSTGESG